MRSASLALLLPGGALSLALLTLAASGNAADPAAPPAGLPAELGASCAGAPSATEIQAGSVAARVAAQFFERGDWDKAIRYWTQAYASDCTGFAVLINLADAYEKRGDKATSTAVLELYLKRSSPAAGKPVPAPSTPPPAPSTPPPAPSTPPPAPSTPPPAPSTPPPASTEVTPPPLPPAAPPSPKAAPAPPPRPPVEPPRAPPASSLDDARTRKGHRFLFPALIDAPFVTTSVRLATEIGAFAQRGVSATPAIDTPFVSSPVIYDRDPRFVQMHFGGGVALNQVFGLEFDGTYSALVGGNLESAFLYGTSSGDDLRPGARVRILRLEGLGTQIGARVHALVQHQTRVRPASLLEEVAKENRMGSNAQRSECLAAGDFTCAFAEGFSAAEAARISRAQYGGGFSVSAAQPLGARFGVVATLGADFATAKLTSLVAGSVSSTPVSVHVGVAPSVDLAPTLPLGAMIEYRLLHTNESFSQSANAPGGSFKTDQHSVAAGLYYTGRTDLQLGMIFAGAFTTSSSSEPLVALLTGRLAARYFF